MLLTTNLDYELFSFSECITQLFQQGETIAAAKEIVRNRVMHMIKI